MGDKAVPTQAGETFERLVKRAAGTFAAAAEALNLNEATLRRYARGASIPSRKTVRIIEEWLRSSLGDVYPPGTLGELWYPGWDDPTNARGASAQAEPASASTAPVDDDVGERGESGAGEEANRELRPPHGGHRWVVWGTALVFALLMVGAGLWFLVDDDPEPPTREVTRSIQIYNKVTGGMQMREDSPAYLSSVPANFCKPAGCMLDGTDLLVTGGRVTAVCQTLAARTTNGDDTTLADDSNPELFESRLWYGIRWTDGRFGFLSEAWVHPDHRGGLDLPLC